MRFLRSKLVLARKNLAPAGFGHRVELREGNATEVIAGLKGPFDCVFFDADRVSAPSQLRLLLPKLSGDVLLLADNALSHPEEIFGLQDHGRAIAGFHLYVDPGREGIAYSMAAGPIHNVALWSAPDFSDLNLQVCLIFSRIDSAPR